MEKKWIKAALLSAFFVNMPCLVLAADEKDHIYFVLNNAAYERIKANCGNFSYPGGWRDIGRTHGYKIEPEGLIWNPRKLQYTCSIHVPYTRSSSDIGTFFPSAFDHTKPHSTVTLTVHSVRKGMCTFMDAYPEQATVIYSLSVDGKPVKDRIERCFYRPKPERDH